MPERLISYAPNGEDIVLWRALGHRPAGTYVDIGACHPVVSSVTKLFSLHGWRGINVEPLGFLVDELRTDRPDDINVQAALSDQPGELTLFVVANDLQRTTLSEPLADLYRAEGYDVQRQQTPVLTLNQLLVDYPLPQIDFLKIDAEGMEDAIVRGIDLARHRPHVIVAEEGSHQTYEFPNMLAANGYQQTLWDGLNRFFVADEHADELASKLSYPAGVHDLYDTYETHQLRTNDALLRADLQRHIDHIDDMHRSATWRIGQAVVRPASALANLIRRRR
jgi:FkbM family methyltransferase